LCRTLEAVLKQDVPNLQVIVVDNASPDGTVDFVRERFPGVELLALSDNVGIRGRNEGFRAARGDVIVSLDDDIELDDPGALRRIRDRFAALPDLGAVSLRICDDPHGTEYAPAHWWHPVPRETHQDVGFETDHINEAAVALRRTALEEVGGYYEPLFWGAEEWDLCLGLMDAGYRIQYLPETVRHLAPRGRLDARADPRHALLIRNRCAAGLWGLARVFTRALRERRVVSRDTLLRLRRLHAPPRDVSLP
jgi:GT2 family glycosyltransferase